MSLPVDNSTCSVGLVGCSSYFYLSVDLASGYPQTKIYNSNHGGLVWTPDLDPNTYQQYPQYRRGPRQNQNKAHTKCSSETQQASSSLGLATSVPTSGLATSLEPCEDPKKGTPNSGLLYSYGVEYKAIKP